MGAPQPLTHQEIRAFRLNMRLDIQPWEVSALIAIDRAWLMSYIENHKAEQDAGPRRREAQVPTEKDAELD